MSNDKFVLGVGPAHKLELRFRRFDFTSEDVEALGSGDLLKSVRDVIRGLSTITPILHPIDCNAAPYIPGGWSYHEEDQLPSRVRGIYAWDPAKVGLYLPKPLKSDKRPMGRDLYRELASHPVLPANVLDYLLQSAHQYLIPGAFGGDIVFFWGTIYRAYGKKYVRYLCRFGEGWTWGQSSLGTCYGCKCAVAVRAS